MKANDIQLGEKITLRWRRPAEEEMARGGITHGELDVGCLKDSMVLQRVERRWADNRNISRTASGILGRGRRWGWLAAAGMRSASEGGALASGTAGRYLCRGGSTIGARLALGAAT